MLNYKKYASRTINMWAQIENHCDWTIKAELLQQTVFFFWTPNMVKPGDGMGQELYPGPYIL